MALSEAQVESEILAWPESARWKLLRSLAESLSVEDEAFEEFPPEYLAELQMRSEQIDNGSAKLIPHEEAMRRISEIAQNG